MKDIKIDPVDKSILRVLQRNGRATINEVSDVVGLSPSPVARRVRLLEEAGIANARGILAPSVRSAVERALADGHQPLDPFGES